MARVTGIGGVFFKAQDPEATRAWYQRHLGIEAMDEYGWSFLWRDVDRPDQVGRTVWGPFDHDTDYFDPSPHPFMINLRVDDLTGMLDKLRQAGVTVLDAVEEYEYGRFGWAIDPNGIKLELWEPAGEEGQP